MFNTDTSGYVGERDRNEFSSDTTPGSFDNDGLPTSVAVRNIVISGQDVTADLLVNDITSVANEQTTPVEFVVFQNYPRLFPIHCRFCL